MEEQKLEETTTREFVSLGDLLGRKHNQSIAILAEAIEKEGIKGFDRFGRFKRFMAGSVECQAALDALAAQYEWQCVFADAPSHDDRSPLETWDDFGEGAFNMGWYANELPKFAEIAASVEPPPRYMSSRQRTQDETLLGAIRKEGFDPLKLPIVRGKPGVKALILKKVPKEIFRTKNIFDKCWDRLRSLGEIANG